MTFTPWQEKCLLAFDGYGQQLPTRSVAYRLHDEDRYHTAVKRTAYTVMKGLEKQGLAESTVFLGQRRWALTTDGHRARLKLLGIT